MEFDVLKYGADNRGIEDSTDSINKAIDECNKYGGGLVVVPSGSYIATSIVMKSNVTLYINGGATISFIPNCELYPVVDSGWEGVRVSSYRSCIYAKDAENISITGKGKLEGNGKYWWDIFRSKELKHTRPKMICVDYCKNVLIEGITIVNSPSWTVHPLFSDIVNIDKVNINNPADSPNTDGINPESCTNVHISNCHIDVGDDCIAIKAGVEDTEVKGSCENITITNCTMVHGHGGVVLGSEMSGDIRNVVISNCVFNGTDRGIRLKTRRGRGGIVEDILVNNVFMKDVICPFVMNMYYFCGPRGKEKYVYDRAPYPITEETPTLRNVQLSNVVARDVHASAGFIFGLAENYVEGVVLNNYTVEFAKNPKPGVPAMMAGIDEMTNKGIFIGNSRDFRLNNVKVIGYEGDEYIMEDTENIEVK